jgi:hypothetical protein
VLAEPNAPPSCYFHIRQLELVSFTDQKPQNQRRSENPSCNKIFYHLKLPSSLINSYTKCWSPLIALRWISIESKMFKFGGVGWDWVHLVCRPLTGLLYQPQMMDEYGPFGEIQIGRWNWSTRRKPAPVPLCPPQIPHDLTWEKTQATTMRTRWLTDFYYNFLIINKFPPLIFLIHSETSL